MTVIKAGAARRGAGFSLIETMLALTIACVLAALTQASFQAYIVKSKRAQAQAMLLQLMQQQERYYSQNNSYIVFSSASTDPDEKLFQWWSGTRAADSAYEIEAVACPATSIAECVRLNAMPGTVNVNRHFRDADCATLSLASTGLRSASGTAPGCWP
jgi:type IV pilus assembly protein PilE